MKKTTLIFVKRTFLMLGAISLISLVSCKKDDAPKVEDPVASFQFAVSETNYLEVTFTNYSQNAATYSWDFGDSQTSTEENPVHEYTEAGTYTVVLTAKNSADVSATYNQSITITDPNAAMAILNGGSSKEWKLFREGKSMGIGASADNPYEWWSLANDGMRPCLYKQTFTFNVDGTYVFDDKGMIWGEGDIFKDTEFNETCFVADAANMKKADGTDVSAWLGGTFNYEYNPTTGKLTVSGTGAYLGIMKLGTSEYVSTPQETITYDVSFDQHDGYDLMNVVVDYGDNYWLVTYVNYSDPNLEPDVVEETAPFGEDLPDITPTAMGITFASHDAADLVVLDTIKSGSIMEFGVDDPTDAGAAKVGKFTRVADVTYQELQFQTYPEKKDIQFDNFTKVSIDVYFPSTNDYTGDLAQFIEIGFGDISETQAGWWTDIVDQQSETDIPLDQWVTYTFNLTDALTRTDLDMMYLNMGGAGHNAGGDFYVRNLIFE